MSNLAEEIEFHKGLEKQKDVSKNGEDTCSEKNGTQDQDFPEILKPGVSNGCTIVELEIDQIKPIDFPDYCHKTQADRPLVAHTDDGYFLLDGQDIIDVARKSQRSIIEVYVFEYGAYSDTKLCIEKVASRIRTLGGDATYMEKIRNTRKLFERLMKDKEYLKRYTHGGNRKNNDSRTIEEDAVYVLSDSLKIERSTVLAHLNYAAYLSDEAMVFLIKLEVKKGALIEAQREKKSLIAKLEGKKLDTQKITENVSQWIKSKFTEDAQGEDRNEHKKNLTHNMLQTKVESGLQTIRTSDEVDYEILKEVALDISKLLIKVLGKTDNLEQLENNLTNESQRLREILTAIERRKSTGQPKE